jgi:hypothetical protein
MRFADSGYTACGIAIPAHTFRARNLLLEPYDQLHR